LISLLCEMFFSTTKAGSWERTLSAKQGCFSEDRQTSG
jgi:hypothetical protein